ncbi:DUF167 domain-containing protein [Candidatus Dependentiae bacterium]|nr:DUF167 domain-containing protein [Candidatus Dependentiae bacterium]
MLIFDVKVTPSSGRNKWILYQNGQLKCFLKSPPEKGLANAELRKTLAKKLKIPRELVEIIVGATSRRKKIKVHSDVIYENLLSILGLEQQMPLNF